MLKATTSHTRRASLQQQPANGYHGKKKNNQPPDGRVVESCYWEKKPLQGREVTLADVIKSYREDFTSLRPGYFLQNLCLQRIPMAGRTVTAGHRYRASVRRAPLIGLSCHHWCTRR